MQYGGDVSSPSTDAPTAASLSVEAMLDDLRTLVEIESPSLDLDALRVALERREKIAALEEDLLKFQAEYIGISADGPYKPEHYRY